VKRRLGFSLVELLVVISIIAVLAALLFPVFQKAKSSAQASVCLSNFKQISQATLLYTGDNDDGLLPSTYNADRNADFTNDRVWPQIVSSYVGDQRIFKCPSDFNPNPPAPAIFEPDATGVTSASYEYTLAKRTNFGYNYLYLAPVVPTSLGLTSQPRTISEIWNPSGTLLYVDSAQITQEGVPVSGTHLVVPPCRFIKSGMSSIDSWPSGVPISNPYLAHVPWDVEETDDKAVTFGGAYPWHDGRMTVVHIDGSVKVKTPDQLASGCTVEKDLRGLITNPSSYTWDLR
jgi:prepilin-type N-terminal cleavage/methylation domain-containing protein